MEGKEGERQELSHLIFARLFLDNGIRLAPRGVLYRPKELRVPLASEAARSARVNHELVEEDLGPGLIHAGHWKASSKTLAPPPAHSCSNSARRKYRGAAIPRSSYEGERCPDGSTMEINRTITSRALRENNERSERTRDNQFQTKPCRTRRVD